MAFTLNEEQRLVQKTARDFSVSHLAPFAAKWDEEEFFPIPTMRQAAELGFAGIYVKDDVGGSQMTRLDAALIFEELVGRLYVDGRLYFHPQHGVVDDRPLRQRRAAAQMAAQAYAHGIDRELLPDGAGLGLGRRSVAHQGRARRR